MVRNLVNFDRKMNFRYFFKLQFFFLSNDNDIIKQAMCRRPINFSSPPQLFASSSGALVEGYDRAARSTALAILAAIGAAASLDDVANMGVADMLLLCLFSYSFKVGPF